MERAIGSPPEPGSPTTAGASSRFDSNLDPIVTIVCAGTILYAGDSIEEILQWQTHELIGKNIKILLLESDHPSVDDFLERCRASPRSGIAIGSVDVLCRRSDGVSICCAVTFWDVSELGDRNAIIAFSVRERARLNRVERAHRELRSLLRQIADNLPGVFWMSDLQSRRIYFVSRSFENLWGRSRQSLYADPRSWIDAIHPDDRSAVRASIESRTPGVPCQCEYRVARPDQSVRWVLDRGFPIMDQNGKEYRRAGVAIDITDLKHTEQELRRIREQLEERVMARTTELSQANRLLRKEVHEHRAVQEALQESQERYRSVVEALDEGIIFLDQNGKALATNAAAERILGLSAQEILSRAPLDARWRVIREDGSPFSPAEHPAVVSLRTGESSKCVVMGVYREGDARTVWISTNSQPLLRASELRPYAVVISFTDITTRRATNEQLRRHREDLAYAWRLHAMGEIADGLAHELNQPLAAVNNYLQSCAEMIRVGADRGRITPALAAASGQIERAGQIIRRRRNFVSRRKPHCSTVAINDLVREILVLVAGELRERRIVTRLELAETLPLICCDKIQIEQVLLNLIRNAIDAMASTPTGPHLLQVRTELSAPGQIEDSVKDNACGVTPEDSPHLFERFYSSKPEGPGIGLALSRSLIEAHGGRLWFVPNQPAGSEFRFSLPITGR